MTFDAFRGNALEIQLFEWILYGASGDCMQQLFKATQSEDLAEIVLFIDIMLLFDYNPSLAEKFMLEFAQVYWNLKHIVQALLHSKIFMLPAESIGDAMELTIRFYNHPRPPSKLHCPLRREMKFIPYAGLVVNCFEPESIGKFDVEETPFQSVRVQRLLIMPKLLKFPELNQSNFLLSNQVHTLIVDREYVGMFHAGQMVFGVGEISLAALLDRKKVIKKCPTLSSFVIYANSVEAMNGNVSHSKFRLKQLQGFSFSSSCPPVSAEYRMSKKVNGTRLNPDIVPTSICQQICSEWKETMSILSLVDDITGEPGFLKPKLLLLLSLVSEPQISTNKSISDENRVDGEPESSVGHLSPKSSSTAQINRSWELSIEDYSAIENQISLFFASNDNRLSRVVNWASNFYPLKTKLTLFSNSNTPDVIPEGSLLLLQGNSLSKKSHINVITRLLKTSSPGNPRNKSCILWGLYPDQLTIAEMKNFRKLAAQSIFQCCLFRTAISNDNEEKVAKESDIVLDNVRIGPSISMQSQFTSLSERLSKARMISVSFTESSRNLIKAFFLTSRIKAEYSLREFHLVIRLARAHARLHLRTNVNVTDATVGIMLVEEMRAELDGTPSKVLGFSTPRDDPCCLYYEYGYDGSSKPTQFLNMFDHVIAVIRQYQLGFRLYAE